MLELFFRPAFMLELFSDKIVLKLTRISLLGIREIQPFSMSAKRARLYEVEVRPVLSNTHCSLIEKPGLVPIKTIITRN